jgi:PAS domain S-box-containing protein
LAHNLSGMDPRGGGVIRWLTRYRTGLAFALVGGLLVAIGIIAFSARELVERQETVRHVTQVLTELDGVLSAVVDAEVAQRGLLMFGDQRYQASYTASVGPIDDRFKALRALAGEDHRRQQQLDALQRLIASRVAELHETERLRQERGVDEARRYVRTGRGLYLTDQIWTSITALKAEERRLLTEESARHSTQALRVLLVLTGLAGAAVVGLALLVVESRRRAGEIRDTRDVLQSQVAEHEKTSALLASIVQSSDDAIIGLRPDGRVLAWNTGAERLYGYRDDEIRDRPAQVLCPGPQQPEVTAALDRVIREQAVERLECEQQTRAGRRIHVFMTISPIRDGAGAAVGASIVARDVTARREAEESLRRSEATARAFLESASESVLVADTAGHIVLVNARTEKLFGYSRAELIGRPVETLIPAALRERHVVHRATYMAAPRVRSMGQGLDLAGLRRDGSEFPVEVSLSFVETGEGVRVIAFVTDISERVAFQRAARQADKLAALGTLSAGIAHEINNPIGIITSRVEVMLLEAEEEGLPTEVRKDLDVILRHARRVATITQGLLSFARQSSGTRKPVNLNQVAEEIVQLARKDMSRARVEVTLKLDETLPVITADANAIGQVLLNLLTNARRAMADGGEITIETSRLAAARAVRVAVRDTGAGIPPEVLPRIFDPFFTTKPDGTGLGLSISHAIVHDHHGTIDVRSEVGKGSTFTLTFPLDGAPEA